LRIYKIVLVVFFASLGCLVGYLISHNIAVAVVCAVVIATVALAVQIIFTIVFAGAVLGAITFVATAMYFLKIVSLICSIICMAIMAIAAVKLFRLAIIIATSAAGSSLVVFSTLVLKEQKRIFADVNLAKMELDRFQFLVGFASLFILGAVIQGIVWWSKGKET